MTTVSSEQIATFFQSWLTLVGQYDELQFTRQNRIQCAISMINFIENTAGIPEDRVGFVYALCDDLSEQLNAVLEDLSSST